MKYKINDPGVIYDKVVQFSQLLLILLMLFAVIMFFMTRSMIDQHTRTIKDDLQLLYIEELEFEVDIDEKIPVQIEVPIGDIVDLTQIIPDNIPIDAAVPISTTVRINETINVPIDIPFVGITNVEVPLDLNVPIEEVILISTDVSINPADLSYPDQVIVIDQEMPINMPFEISLSMEDLGLDDKFRGMESLINTVRFVFLLRGLDWS